MNVHFFLRNSYTIIRLLLSSYCGARPRGRRTSIEMIFIDVRKEDTDAFCTIHDSPFYFPYKYGRFMAQGCDINLIFLKKKKKLVMTNKK